VAAVSGGDLKKRIYSALAGGGNSVERRPTGETE
jgi:hypothetical protein